MDRSGRRLTATVTRNISVWEKMHRVRGKHCSWPRLAFRNSAQAQMAIFSVVGIVQWLAEQCQWQAAKFTPLLSSLSWQRRIACTCYKSPLGASVQVCMPKSNLGREADNSAWLSFPLCPRQPTVLSIPRQDSLVPCLPDYIGRSMHDLYWEPWLRLFKACARERAISGRLGHQKHPAEAFEVSSQPLTAGVKYLHVVGHHPVNSNATT